jgi:hypothetical protein
VPDMGEPHLHSSVDLFQQPESVCELTPPRRPLAGATGSSLFVVGCCDMTITAHAMRSFGCWFGPRTLFVSAVLAVGCGGAVTPGAGDGLSAEASVTDGREAEADQGDASTDDLVSTIEASLGEEPVATDGVASEAADGDDSISESGCGPGTTDCGSGCVDFTTDSANCGACGVACAVGTVCSMGECQCVCAGGMTTCGSPCTCTDLQVDPNNCSACGMACPVGCICSFGSCNCGCGGPGKTLCNGYCADLTVDPSNCGACGLTCLPGQMCLTGSCVCGCPAGWTSCGTPCFCTDAAIDPKNCGGCGNACDAGAACVNGQCT